MEDDDRLGRPDDLMTSQRLQALRTAVEELGGVLRSEMIMAAAATDQRTATLLRGIQALRDAAVEAAAEAEDADGVVASSSSSSSGVDARNAPPQVADPQQQGGAVDHDDENVDDDDNSSVSLPFIETFGFREAVSHLQDPDDRRPICVLEVNDTMEDDDADYELEFEDDDGTLSFHRFVNLLGLEPHEGGAGRRAVHELHLVSAGWVAFPDNDMERLFQHVLPGHPTLQTIRLNIGTLDASYVRMLTESVPTETGAWPLSNLALYVYEEDREFYPYFFDDNIQAIVDMLNRNAAIPELWLDLKLEADDCRRICQALPRSTNVRKLLISLHELFADNMLDGVAPPSLRQLVVRAPFSEATLLSLSRQLRTNTTLESLSAYRSGDEVNADPQVLVDLVRTNNYTLRYVETNLISGPRAGQVCQQLREYMDRNEHIRKVLQGLQDDPSGTVTPSILALLLHLVSDVPTLVQRFVKQYYVNVVTERLALGAGDGLTGRRGRRRRRRD